MLVVHVPVILGSLVGLLFLEDRELLPALATTPAGLATPGSAVAFAGACLVASAVVGGLLAPRLLRSPVT